MEAQIALLRAMSQGLEPVTPENLKKAFNRDVLMERAVARQTESTEATLRALTTEIEGLETTIARRESQLTRVDTELDRYTEEAKPSADVRLQKLRHPVQRLAEGHLSALGLGDPQEVTYILWRLLEVTARNEQLVVPANLRIVQFLVDEALLRSEPVGRDKVRIRLY